MFELFRGPHSGDFSSARFFRYRKLDAKEGVLSRFDDGAVALAGRSVGKGRVVVWTSSIDTAWNDLALQPVFLPFLHQLARHTASHVESPAWHTVGEALDLSREVVAFVQKLRQHDLFKLPGVAETIDWTDALVQLDQVALDAEAIDSSLGALLKYQDDIARIRGSEAAGILEQVRADMAAETAARTLRH